MTRLVPGLEQVAGREFIYVEIRGGEGFAQLVSGMLTSCPDVPLPQSGGIIEEKARIAVDKGSSLLALSYKGDLVGWHRKIVAFCQDSRRIWGTPKNGVLALSNGTQVALDVVFWSDET
jgi:hypothetical protein